jgi:hypothetical protein
MEPASDAQHVKQENLPGKSPLTFRERIELERQQNGEG